MKLSPLARVTARHALALSVALLGLRAGAQGLTELPAPLNELYPPATTLLHAAPDVTLQPDTTGRTVLIATRGTTTLKQVAARYGVTAGAVAFLPRDEQGGRLVRLNLPERAVQRAPVRPASIQTYRVRSGDSLASVARRFDLSVLDLLGANLNLSSLSAVHPGDILNIPTGARGLLVRIKPGQSAWSLIAGYGADLLSTVQANDVLPTELRVGDELLLPGVRPEGLRRTLLAQEEQRRKAQAAARKQAQYDTYLAWQAERERAKLKRKYEQQARYEAFLAWKNSPERQARIAAYERQAQYEAAQAKAQERARQAAATASAARPTVRAASSGAHRLVWPMTTYRLTSRYAERDIAFHQQVFHGGIDLAAPYGTPIYAAADGAVTQSGYGAFGLNVYTVSGDSTIIYGHMSRTAVVSGQQVRQGQLLGYIGCTGVCTGPHLHFEVRLAGQPVDPLALLP